MYKLLIVFLLTLSYFAFGQTDSQIQVNVKPSKIDTNYIEDLSDNLNLFVYGKTKYKRFGIENKQTNQRINYLPNDKFNVGFGFNYKWMGLGLAFNLPFINNDDDKYGKTKRFDAQMNVFTHRFLLDFYFNFYKGYYLSNRLITSKLNNSKQYPLVPSMTTSDFGLSYYYILNHKKFSYRASFVQNERQKKMCGSMILGVIAHLSHTSADTSLTPTSFLKDIDKIGKYKLNSFSDFDLGPMFGYAYNFVIRKKILITVSVVPGLVLQRLYARGHYEGKDYNIEKVKLGFVFNNRFAISYNGDFYFWGFNYNDFHSLHNYEKILTSSNVGNFRFFWGRRFGKIKKKVKS